MLKKSAIVCLIVVGIALVALEIVNTRVQAYLSQPLQVTNDKMITVEKGDSLISVLSKMTDQHWIAPSMVSHFVHHIDPELADVKTGTYQLAPTMTLKDFLMTIVEGKEYQFSITFVEGSRFSDWLRILNQSPMIDHKLQGMSEADIAQSVGISRTKLEGMFLAETYHYTKGTSDVAILRRAHAKLETILNQMWSARKADLPLKSPYDALVLASIIEKETGLESERRTVAAVFVNRLKQHMRLQTDPTVIYGLGGEFTGNLTKKDLRKPSPYNTYLHAGLPPTPIAMVGRSSIDAALNPDDSDYLYFVATGHGGHVFSKTLAAHNIAVRNYIRQLRKQK